MPSLSGHRRKASRSDPAPSRWAWRMQRLMLTPAFLLLLRAGLPLAAAFVAASYYLSDESRREAIRDSVAETRASFEARPEFMVRLMSVDGAGKALAEDIRDVVPITFPVSSFDLNLTDIRTSILELAPVRNATVRVKPGGVLQVEVEPRIPVVIWRNHDGLELIDVTGAFVAPIETRMMRPDLPLIAGEGADARVKEALELYRALAPLGTRLRGMVRMGKRRWDVVLDRGQRILLPETGPVEALERVIALDIAQDILSRDVTRVDLRLGARPTVQMSEYAAEMWQEIRQVSGQ